MSGPAVRSALASRTAVASIARTAVASIAAMERVEGVERVLGLVVLRVVGGLLVAAAVVALVAPRQPNITYDLPVVRSAVTGLLLALLAPLVLRALRGLGRRPGPSTRLGRRPQQWPGAGILRRHQVGCSVVVTLAGSVACTVVALNLVYAVGWDANGVRTLARRLVEHRILTPVDYSYLSTFSNNLPLLLVDRICEQAGRAWGWSPSTVFVLLNGACLAVTVQSVYSVVRRLRGAASAVAAQLLTLALLGLSPWMAVPYTDTLALPFPVLGTALAVAALQSRSVARRVLLVTGALSAFAVGYVVKTTPVVSLVALVLVGLAVVCGSVTGSRRPRRGWAAALAGVTVLALATVAFFAGSTLLQRQVLRASGLEVSRVEPGRNPPAIWWVAMGVGVRRDAPHLLYGAYDGRMVAATGGMSGAEMTSYSTALLRNRLGRYGAVGYAGFVADKFVWNWGDGMFWAYGEGPDAERPVLADGPLTAWATSWNNPQGRDYLRRADLARALWLVVLGLAGVGLLRYRYRREVLLLALSVLGIALFTVLFQGRSRYLFVYVPVVIATAMTVQPLGRRHTGHVSERTRASQNIHS